MLELTYSKLCSNIPEFSLLFEVLYHDSLLNERDMFAFLYPLVAQVLWRFWPFDDYVQASATVDWLGRGHHFVSDNSKLVRTNKVQLFAQVFLFVILLVWKVLVIKVEFLLAVNRIFTLPYMLNSSGSVVLILLVFLLILVVFFEAVRDYK